MFLHNLSHYLLLGVLPPGLMLLIMLVGFILNCFKIRFGKVVVATGYLLLWLLSTQTVAQCLMDGLQNQYPLLATASVVNKDAAIVVLGMGIDAAREYDQRYVASEKTQARVNYAAYLSKKTGLPIIVSGGNRDYAAHTEAGMMQAILETNFGINVLAAETTSRNTDEQSHLILPILKAKNIHTVYLVTNAWHMPRSMYAFNYVLAGHDIKVIAAPMGYTELKSGNAIVNLLPILKALTASSYAMYEYMGLVWYHCHQPIYST